MPLYETLGFTTHPFAKTNADEEPNLNEYFVPPAYFDAVVGDAASPTASVVLAPRGAGKTALRRMVESHSITSGFLAVTYDRFEFGAGQKICDISLQYHLRNIIARILLSFLSYASDYPDVIKSLPKDERRQLAIFVQTYLGDLTGGSLQELLKELKGIPERFKEFWSQNVGFLESAVNFVLKSNSLPSIDIPDVKQEEKRLSEAYKHQLEMLLSLTQKLGFRSIYVLIDKPDETEQTSNDPEATYQLVRPMLRDLELLALNGYGFKFFLWDQIEPHYRKDARPDRIAQYNLKWTQSGLKNVLSRRLNAFSNNMISTLGELVSGAKDINIDDAVCLMSNGSPRNMIRMCEIILATQAERSQDSSRIDMSAVDQGVINFSEMVFRENYGDNMLKDIQRVGRELFTTNYVANDILKITGQGARNKITGWSKAGLVEQVGTVAVPPAKRPVNFYCVVDPVAVRLINRTVPFEEFVKDRWLPCGHCGADNLIDIELYPKDNPPLCKSCGRELL